MPTDSFVITVLFNTKDQTFLGRGGRWQSCDEFLRNPPAKTGDVVPPTKQPERHKNKGDPGGGYRCIDGVFCFVDIDPSTGEEVRTELFSPCPPGW
jgi:hypothetical protein